MTDPNQKTLVDLKPYGAGPAGRTGDTVRELDTVATPAPHERAEFDPYKFQSHPMPTELRAEILEHAGHRAAAGAGGAQATSVASEDSVIIDDETQRVADTVLVKRVVRRRFRRRALVVGVFFGSLGAGLAVWTRDPKPRTTGVAPALQPPRPLPSSALPQTLPPLVAKTRAPEDHAVAEFGSASSSGLPSRAVAASAPKALPKPPSTRRAAATARRALPSVSASASKAAAAGTDLLNFEGPAPK
jgi:hypothetical protein